MLFKKHSLLLILSITSPFFVVIIIFRRHDTFKNKNELYFKFFQLLEILTHYFECLNIIPMTTANIYLLAIILYFNFNYSTYFI